MKYYSDYWWDHGVPRGLGGVAEPQEVHEAVYKIVSDPYHRRISVEKYFKGHFKELVYDSALFDFRWLKPVEQNAWSSQLILEEEHRAVRLLRNQDDRIVAKEVYHFEAGQCRQSEAFHPSGVQISVQKMYYVHLGDPVNQVVLFDRSGRQVVVKDYECDEATGEFTVLLKEQWQVRQEYSRPDHRGKNNAKAQSCKDAKEAFQD